MQVDPIEFFVADENYQIDPQGLGHIASKGPMGPKKWDFVYLGWFHIVERDVPLFFIGFQE